MAELQICPHCEKTITKQDLFEYSAKLERIEKERKEKEKLEPIFEEFRNSRIFRKEQRIFFASLILFFLSIFPITALTILYYDFREQHTLLTVSLFILWGAGSVGWSLYLIFRLDKIRDKFVSAKLQNL